MNDVSAHTLTKSNMDNISSINRLNGQAAQSGTQQHFEKNALITKTIQNVECAISGMGKVLWEADIKEAERIVVRKKLYDLINKMMTVQSIIDD